MTRPKEVYFNKRQIEFASAKQKLRVWVGGRGSGKSAGIALVIRRMVEELPRGKCLFGSTTLEQIYNSTLPPVIEKLNELGFKENIHYVLRKKPPEWFKKPFTAPTEYENTLTFFNGFTLVFISTAKPVGKRGGSYDAAIVDEAAFVKALTFRSVLVPMVRANLYRYESDLHHCIFLLTSQPKTADGTFIMEFEKEQIADPSEVLFLWTSALENKLVLGEEWFALMRKTMGYSEYLKEVENVKSRKLPQSFYHRFDRDKQGYTADKGANGQLLDLDPNALLEVSFDFSGHFNCATVWQERMGTEYCVRRFHTKQGEDKAVGVARLICEELKEHKFRYIRLYGEPRGKDDNPYSDDDLYTQIEKVFRSERWEVEQRIPAGKQAKRHKQRHLIFETLFNETDPSLPKIRINIETCEDVIVSIENTGIKNDFQKDKSREGNEQYPQEKEPHYGDTMDNYIDQKYYWRFSNESNERPGDYGFM